MAAEDETPEASIAKVDRGARLAREMKLVIVESPAKAKTIAGYLGKEFVVESSIGHVRDLPHNAAEIPAKYKAESWSRLGVDVENDFEPLYVVDSRKKKVVSDLKAKLKNADELLLATDEDREGEAIAWHLREVLKPTVPVRRMVFHEITREAIQEAADKGHIRALFALGSIASSGMGTAVDAAKANSLYSKASDQGDPYAMAAWGRALFNGFGVQPDTGKGLDLLLQAAAMGHVDAMKDLAVIFQEGRNGVPADPARALAFLRAGMDRQDVYSMAILGLSPKPRTPTIAVCKPRVVTKVVTKVKVVPAPTPIAPPPKATPAAPGNPIFVPSWRGSGGDQDHSQSQNSNNSGG